MDCPAHRPFSRTPAIDSVPADIFVTAVDTHPLSADPAFIINENAQAFEDGLKVLTRLTEGNVFCARVQTPQFRVVMSAV
ncbi:hypothetical protein HAALTHF_41080n [Vreelandella aquamarina]|nr:hypothetical protein HAALTHF_41080n [Halomonas axialensis]